MSSEQLTGNSKLIRSRAIVCAAVLAAVLSASCVESAPAGPISVLVPANAIAAVIVESPYKLYAASEVFWKAAGLDKTVGSSLQDLMTKSIPNASDALQTLDFARPWALAFLPGEGSKKPRQVLYIAYRSKPDAFVDKMFGTGAMHLIANAKGYLVLSDSDGGLAFPPDKGADLSRLSRYPASSIKLWGDPAAIKRAFSDGYKPIEEAIRAFVTPPAEAGTASAGNKNQAATKALGELGISILAQLGLADASIEPGASGIVMRIGAASKPGSDLSKAVAAASLAPSALDWASQVRADAIYGYAWSMDPSIAANLSMQLMEPLLTSFGVSKEIAAKATSMQAKWAKAEGPRGAISLDVDLDSATIAAAKDFKSEDPSKIADLVKKMVRIRFDMLQDVKDEAGYRALIKGLATDPDFIAFTKAYTESFGVSIGFKNQDKKDGAFVYGDLGLDIKVVDASKMNLKGSSSSSASAEAALSALGSLISMRWTVANGRFVATGGDLDALKALAARKTADQSLAADPVFAAFAKTMPPKTFMVGTFSMRKLMALISQIMAASGASGGPSKALPDASLFGSWYSYFAVDSRAVSPGIEAGFLFPASDIGALVKSGGALMKAASPSGGV